MNHPDFGLLSDSWSWGVRPLQAVWLGWLILALRLAPRDRAVWGVVALAMGGLAVLGGPAGSLPHGKGWWQNVTAAGAFPTADWREQAYGDAWESAGSLLTLVTWDPADAGRWLAWIATVATVVAVLDAGRHLSLGEGWSRATASVYALMPVVVAMGQTVDRFLLLPLLVTAALAAWLRLGTREDARLESWWFGLLSVVLLVHSRPLAVLVSGVLLGMLWIRRPPERRLWTLGVGVGLSALWVWRVVGLSALLVSQGMPGAAKAGHAWNQWSTILSALLGWIAWDPAMVPVLLVPLALAGLALGRGHDRFAVGLVLVASALPWLHFGFAFDRLRMHLGSLPPLVLLAAMGVHGVGARRWVSREFLAGLLVPSLLGSWWLAREPRGQPVWSWVPEEALFREGLPTCDRSLPVYIGPERSEWNLAQWLVWKGWQPARFSPEVDAPEGACRFVGLDAWEDDVSVAPPTDGWREVQVRRIEVSSDGWYAREGQTIIIGWYRRESPFEPASAASLPQHEAPGPREAIPGLGGGRLRGDLAAQ